MSLYKITHTSLVHAWNCCMSTLRHVSVQEDCSKHVAGQQKNSCRGTWCVCAEQRTICRQVNEVNVEDPPQPNVYYCYCYCYFSVTHLISVHVIMFVSASWRWHRCWEWSWRGYVIPVQDIETCRSIWRRSRLLIFRDCESCKTISTCGYVCVCGILFVIFLLFLPVQNLMPHKLFVCICIIIGILSLWISAHLTVLLVLNLVLNLIFYLPPVTSITHSSDSDLIFDCWCYLNWLTCALTTVREGHNACKDCTEWVQKIPPP